MWQQNVGLVCNSGQINRSFITTDGKNLRLKRMCKMNKFKWHLHWIAVHQMNVHVHTTVSYSLSVREHFAKMLCEITLAFSQFGCSECIVACAFCLLHLPMLFISYFCLFSIEICFWHSFDTWSCILCSFSSRIKKFCENFPTENSFGFFSWISASFAKLPNFASFAFAKKNGWNSNKNKNKRIKTSSVCVEPPVCLSFVMMCLR